MIELTAECFSERDRGIYIHTTPNGDVESGMVIRCDDAEWEVAKNNVGLSNERDERTLVSNGAREMEKVAATDKQSRKARKEHALRKK